MYPKDLEIKDSFDNLLDNKVGGIVVFYAPWCGHCKDMKDINTFLGNEINKKYNVFLKTVNCDIQKKIAEDYGINSFPTIKYVGENGNFHD